MPDATAKLIDATIASLDGYIEDADGRYAVRADLELLDDHRFRDGVVHLHSRVRV